MTDRVSTSYSSVAPISCAASVNASEQRRYNGYPIRRACLDGSDPVQAVPRLHSWLVAGDELDGLPRLLTLETCYIHILGRATGRLHRDIVAALGLPSLSEALLAGIISGIGNSGGEAFRIEFGISGGRSGGSRWPLHPRPRHPERVPGAAERLTGAGQG